MSLKKSFRKQKNSRLKVENLHSNFVALWLVVLLRVVDLLAHLVAASVEQELRYFSGKSYNLPVFQQWSNNSGKIFQTTVTDLKTFN